MKTSMRFKAWKKDLATLLLYTIILGSLVSSATAVIMYYAGECTRHIMTAVEVTFCVVLAFGTLMLLLEKSFGINDSSEDY